MNYKIDDLVQQFIDEGTNWNFLTQARTLRLVIDLGLYQEFLVKLQAKFSK